MIMTGLWSYKDYFQREKYQGSLGISEYHCVNWTITEEYLSLPPSSSVRTTESPGIAQGVTSSLLPFPLLQYIFFFFLFFFF